MEVRSIMKSTGLFEIRDNMLLDVLLTETLTEEFLEVVFHYSLESLANLSKFRDTYGLHFLLNHLLNLFAQYSSSSTRATTESQQIPLSHKKTLSGELNPVLKTDPEKTPSVPKQSTIGVEQSIVLHKKNKTLCNLGEESKRREKTKLNMNKQTQLKNAVLKLLAVIRFDVCKNESNRNICQKIVNDPMLLNFFCYDYKGFIPYTYGDSTNKDKGKTARNLNKAYLTEGFHSERDHPSQIDWKVKLNLRSNFV